MIDIYFKAIQDHYINEALRPKPTKFGTNFPDFDNRQWMHTTYIRFPVTSTLFDSEDRWVVVDILPNHNIVYRTIQKLSKLQSTQDILDNAGVYKYKSQFKPNVADIIQRTLWLGFSKIKDCDEWGFSGDEKLASIYDRMIGTTAFKDEIKKMGFKLKSASFDNEDQEFSCRFEKIKL